MKFFNDLSKEVNARGFYEGGKLSKINRDFNTAFGAFEETAEPDRHEMVKRARWLHENNPICSNIDETLVSNTINVGFKLKSKHPDKTVQMEIQDKYKQRMENKDLFDLSGRLTGVEFERVLMGARMVDGDALVNYVTTNDPINPIKLQGIETSDFDVYANGTQKREVFSGVEVDARGKAVYYHVGRKKVGVRYSNDSTRIPAKQAILHMKTENRFTQFRGVSEYKQTIVDLKNFSAYTTSTIQGARLRSQLPYYVTSQDPSSAARNNRTPNDKYGDIQEINGLMVHYLNTGEELKQLDPSAMGENARDFLTFAVRLIAAGRKVSYELAFRDYERVNFASSRASILQDNRKFDYEQLLHVSNYKNKDFELWLDAMVLGGHMKTISPARYFIDKEEYLKKEWIPPARPFVDPLKDITAVKEELSIGLTTLTREAGRKGLDIEVLREEIKEEKAAFEKAGLTYPNFAGDDAELATKLILEGETNV